MTLRERAARAVVFGLVIGTMLVVFICATNP